MTEFNHVSIIKKANIYFDGKVTSWTLNFPDGSQKTLGVMLPGEYEFNTQAREIMEILSGDLEILLAGESNWKVIKGGESFEVPANSKFSVKAITISDYCCSFVQ